jgi:hypothetical protein
LVITGYTVQYDDYIIVCSATTAQDIYLPEITANIIGRNIYIKGIGMSLTIYPNGTDLIDYSSSLTILNTSTLNIVAMTGNWYIL